MKLHSDQGSTFIEVILGLLLVGIIYSGVSFFFYHQRSNIENQRITNRAICEVASEIEYWQGKIAQKELTRRDMFGYINAPYKIVKLDSTRDVFGEIYLDRINEVDDVETTTNPDFFEFRVWMEWTDLDSQEQVIELNGIQINQI